MNRKLAVALMSLALIPARGACEATAGTETLAETASPRASSADEACAIYRALLQRFVEQVRALPVEEAKRKALLIRASLDYARDRCEAELAKQPRRRSFATFRAKKGPQS